ncbi:hypothetical protein D3C78_1308080 [compost metagenome]
MLQCVVNQPPRRVFFTQDHRVFQIEHQRIGLINKGVAYHRRVGTGHEQHAATQAVFIQRFH